MGSIQHPSGSSNTDTSTTAITTTTSTPSTSAYGHLHPILICMLPHRPVSYLEDTHYRESSTLTSVDGSLVDDPHTTPSTLDVWGYSSIPCAGCYTSVGPMLEVALGNWDVRESFSMQPTGEGLDCSSTTDTTLFNSA